MSSFILDLYRILFHSLKQVMKGNFESNQFRINCTNEYLITRNKLTLIYATELNIVTAVISDIFQNYWNCASPGGNGKILDKDLKELRAPSGGEVGVAQPVVKADILLDLGWEEMSNRKDFLDTSQCCKLVQKEPEEIIRLYRLLSLISESRHLQLKSVASFFT